MATNTASRFADVPNSPATSISLKKPIPFDKIEKVRIAIVPAATDVDPGIFLITPPVPHSIIYHTSDLSLAPTMVN
jgi:hypothetical protein